MSAFVCLECGWRFGSLNSAMRGTEQGCPGCGSYDIDFGQEEAHPITGLHIPGTGTISISRKDLGTRATQFPEDNFPVRPVADSLHREGF